jgi:transaldolase|tara:strand:- start:75 stop:770 length:696 start_codon:yes stop_codon:yes gene_type:complete
MTKIFCDTADINVIKKFSRKNIVKGFTTNPSLMRKAGAKNYKIYSKMILQESKNKPVSLEVFADDYDNMKKQAFEIASWEKNIYVKIPVVNSKNLFTGKLIRELSAKKIKLNITAVYTFKQAKKIISCLDKKSKCIISMFIGRAADAGKDPIPEMLKTIEATKNNNNIEILWASVREPYNFIQAKKIGCQIITVPPSIIDKIEKFGKSYKHLTIDTVNGFLIDSKKSKFKI